MLDLSSSLAQLPAHHQTALQWFNSHRAQDLGWPSDLPDGTHLASRAKGIYKPNWTSYALSVRQSLAGPYPDKDPDVPAQWHMDLPVLSRELGPGKTGLSVHESGTHGVYEGQGSGWCLPSDFDKAFAKIPNPWPSGCRRLGRRVFPPRRFLYYRLGLRP